MPEYLAPGLFIEEIDSGSKPIEGVGTNTVAFFGYAKSGEFNKPTFISNWTQFTSLFGEEENAITKALCNLLSLSVPEVRSLKKASRKGWYEFAQQKFEEERKAGKTKYESFQKFLEGSDVPLSSSPYIDGSYMAHAVRGFYDNGGGRAYIVRVARPEDVDALSYQPAKTGVVQPAKTAQLTAGPLLIRSAQDGATGNQTKVEIEHVGDGQEFRIKVSHPGKPAEVFPNEKSGFTPEAAVAAVNAKSKLIQLEVAPGTNVATATRPQVIAGLNLEGGLDAANLPATTSSTALAASLPKELKDLVANDWQGDTAKRTGLGSIEAIEDIDIICAPDLMHDVFVREFTLVEESRGQKRKVFKEEQPNPNIDLEARTKEILAAQKALVDYCERAGNRMCILDPLPGLTPQGIDELTYGRMGNYGCDKGQATIYYPWIRIADPVNRGEQILVPPSGHIAGVWARVALERGVHKAPANEVLMGAVGLETEITKGEQEKLNPNGINCIRAFPGMGIRVWGARTLATVGNPSWKYVNVRRLFNYLEKSMERNLQWVVFEPNDEDLWGRVRRTISAFLYTEWREGKLFGATPDQAFYVKCDGETNPQETIDLGRMYVEIGVNPVKPAEFVIIRMGQWSGGSSLSEQ